MIYMITKSLSDQLFFLKYRRLFFKKDTYKLIVLFKKEEGHFKQSLITLNKKA